GSAPRGVPRERREHVVPHARRRPPTRALPDPPPLRQRPEQVIKPGRIPLQRARRRRTRQPSRHHTLPKRHAPPPPGIPRPTSKVNKLPLPPPPYQGLSILPV